MLLALVDRRNLRLRPMLSSFTHAEEFSECLYFGLGSLRGRFLLRGRVNANPRQPTPPPPRCSEQDEDDKGNRVGDGPPQPPPLVHAAPPNPSWRILHKVRQIEDDVPDKIEKRYRCGRQERTAQLSPPRHCRIIAPAYSLCKRNLSRQLLDKWIDTHLVDTTTR